MPPQISARSHLVDGFTGMDVLPISGVVVDILAPGLLPHRLTGLELRADLSGSNRVYPGIEVVELVVHRHGQGSGRYGARGARLAGQPRRGREDVREMERTRAADVMERVLGGDFGRGVARRRQVGHNALRVVGDPSANGQMRK